MYFISSPPPTFSTYPTMQITFQPENLVLIFKNSDWLYSRHCFIKVLPEFENCWIPIKGLREPVKRKLPTPNPTGITLATNDVSTSRMILQIGDSCEGVGFENKKQRVSNAIASPLFDKKPFYLYMFEGHIPGYYSFANNLFTPFANASLAQNSIHEFFYKVMSLSDVPLNRCAHETTREIQQANAGKSWEDRNAETEDAVEIDNSDSDDDDSSSEEEVHVVLQTGPIRPKKMVKR